MSDAVEEVGRFTREDYMRLPESGPQYQLIQGELYMSPSPIRYHQTILRNLVFVMVNYLKENPIGILYFAPFDLTLSEINIFQPDILFVTNDNKSILTKQGAEGAPDLVIEILSKFNEKFDKGIKREIYAKCGVTEYWIVNPAQKDFQIYDFMIQSEQPIGVISDHEMFQSKLFPGLDIVTNEIFQED